MKSDLASAELPPGALIAYLQKGLQYVSIESQLNEDGTEQKSEGNVSLMSSHVVAVNGWSGPKSEVGGKGASGGSKKRSTPKTARNNDVEMSDAGSGSGSNKAADKAKGRVVDTAKRHKNGANASSAGAGATSAAKQQPIDNVDKIPEDDVSVLTSHKSEVFICAWNPQSDLLASGSGDSTARIWTIPPGKSGKMVGQEVSKTPLVLQHSNTDVKPTKSKDVTTLEWNRKGTMLATGSYDGQARIWSKEGQLQQTLTRHKGPIFSLKWSQNGEHLLSGSYDKTAVIWDTSTGAVKQQFNFHKAPTLDVDWKDNESFATCSTDKAIHLCKLGEAEAVRTWASTPTSKHGHTDEVNAIKWNPSGTLLASCSDDFTAKIWSPNEDKPLHDFREHKKEIYTIKWSPTGPNTDNPNKPLVMASASFDATIKLWDVEAGKSLYTLTRHSDPVYSVAFSPNGDYLASGSLCGLLHIWSAKDGTLLKTFHGGGDIFEVSWSASGDKVAACFSNYTVCVVDFNKL